MGGRLGRPELLWLVASMLVCLAEPAQAEEGGAQFWAQPALPGPTRGPELLFTFDDGPHIHYTGPVLDVLARHKVRAIFFFIGRDLLRSRRAARYREIVQRVVREGHVVGNHTLDHAHLCLGTAAEAQLQLDEAQHQLEDASGGPVLFFRTPYGARCPQLEELLAARGMQHFHWDVDPQEWRSHDPELTRDLVIEHIQGRQGRMVILLHDAQQMTASALEEILVWIEAENLRRRALGKVPIRVLGPEDVASITLAPGLLADLSTLQRALTDMLPGLSRAFLGPLCLGGTQAAQL